MRFKIGLPDNIFTNMLASSFPREFYSFYYLSNSEILKSLINEQIDLAIIPSLEIQNENKIYVSRKLGIAFDGPLSDDYLYYVKDTLNVLKIAGSVSLNEILLSKIIFKENYDTEPIQEVLPSVPSSFSENFLVSGDENFTLGIYQKGDSFAEHVSDFIDTPYLKYIVVSLHKENIEMLHQNTFNPEAEIEVTFPSILKSLGYNEKIIDFVKQNFDGIYFEQTENEINGFEEMRKLPFYYGYFEEVKDIIYV